MAGMVGRQGVPVKWLAFPGRLVGKPEVTVSVAPYSPKFVSPASHVLAAANQTKKTAGFHRRLTQASQLKITIAN
jgi:hypothetical protein